MSAKMTVNEACVRPSEGLVDGGHVYLRCSNCNAVLMDIIRTRPHEKDLWKLKASCPFCDKGGSYIEEVQGGFHPGGFGVVKEDDPEDDIPSTVIGDIKIVGDIVQFTVIKANTNAKPVTRI